MRAALTVGSNIKPVIVIEEIASFFFSCILICFKEQVTLRAGRQP